jgi:hypothetical protein
MASTMVSIASPIRGLACAVVAACVALDGAAAVQPSLPPQLESYLAEHVKLTAHQRSQLVSGHAVTRLLETDPSREVGVFGAVWVNAPASRYVALVKDIEQFEKGANFRITRRISDPPRPEDFAQMDLPDDDVRDLRRCRVGSCELKLSEAALTRVRKEIDWSRPTARADAEALARRLAFEYVKGYLEGGNARLATYRDSSRPTFVGEEFKSMIERMPALTALPDLRKYLLEFPAASVPNAHAFLYWQEAQFGLKPTIRINHLVISEQPTHVAIASKMLYASHYFWTALELRVLVPDAARGAGFWFVSVNRSRSDGLSGFLGTMIRGKVRGEAEKGMTAALRMTKDTLERRAR